MFAYVGSRTTVERNARGEGISVYRVHPDSALELVQLVTDLINPSFLARSVDGRRLYAVHGDMADITSFAIDPHTGKLTSMNTQSTRGKNPVHLAIDPTGKYVIVSNHIGASLAVLPIAPDGSLEAVSQLLPLEGPIGPHRIEQTQAKPHFNLLDPTGRFVVVPDKGLDRIFVFRFEGGKLTPTQHAFIVTRETAGPRHVAFHPQNAYMYCVNELDSTVTSYRYAADSGALIPLQILSTLPDTYTGNSRASEIEVARNGRYVYASNRGHDSIAIFAIDQASGRLSFVDAESTRGHTPRYITSTPDGRVMYALNEDSDSIVAFAIDDTTGRLAYTGCTTNCGSPVCMVFSGRDG
ncbi:lactonase family protein [Trinickia sp. EG282A]|uniref:lactonase family protein n=1 Tax=Trinickia sp. EG282A TaxID=3237013 RepID=UPI0034D15C33